MNSSERRKPTVVAAIALAVGANVSCQDPGDSGDAWRFHAGEEQIRESQEERSPDVGVEPDVVADSTAPLDSAVAPDATGSTEDAGDALNDSDTLPGMPTVQYDGSLPPSSDKCVERPKPKGECYSELLGDYYRDDRPYCLRQTYSREGEQLEPVSQTRIDTDKCGRIRRIMLDYGEGQPDGVPDRMRVYAYGSEGYRRQQWVGDPDIDQGRRLTYRYNERNFVSGRTEYEPGESPTDFTYTYDASGNRVRADFSGTGGYVRYRYDAKCRKIEEVRPNDSKSDPEPEVTERWAYRNGGSVTISTRGLGGDGVSKKTKRKAFIEEDRLVGTKWWAKVPASSPEWTFRARSFIEHDAEGRTLRRRAYLTDVAKPTEEPAAIYVHHYDCPWN